jgi:hypothetical protein
MQISSNWCNQYSAHRELNTFKCLVLLRLPSADEIASPILTWMPSLKVRETGLKYPPPELVEGYIHTLLTKTAFAFRYSGQLLHEVEGGEYSKSLCPSETNAARGQGSSELQTCVRPQAQCKLSRYSGMWQVPAWSQYSLPQEPQVSYFILGNFCWKEYSYMNSPTMV